MDNLKRGIRQEETTPIGRRDEQRRRVVACVSAGQCRVVLIIGKILTGKVHFAEQVASDLRLNSWKHGFIVETTLIPCKDVEKWDTFLRHVATSLNMVGKNCFAESDIEAEISRRLNGRLNTSLLLLFTKCEDLAANETLFQKFCQFSEHVLRTFDRVGLMITSQTYLRLSYRYDIYVTNLNPLSPVESVGVLNNCVPGFKVSNVQQIVKLVKVCRGRPPLLLKSANILQRYKGILSIENYLDVLENPDKALEVFSRHPSPEGSLQLAVERQFCRLPKPLQDNVIALSGVEGSFGFEVATARLGEETVADFKMKTFIPLHEHSILDFDIKLNKMSIDPFIRAFIHHKYPDVRHNDFRRKELEDFLGEILIQMRREVCVKSMGRVLGYPHDDFKALDTTITAAISTKTDSFALCMEVVKREEGFMANVSSKRALQFYITMLESSKKYGNAEDQAVMKGFLGLAMAESKGCELVEAESLLTEAIKELKDNDFQYYQILFKRHLAWNNIRQGKNRTAERYLLEALGISVRNNHSKARIQKILASSHLAIVNCFLGDFDDAERILLRNLSLARRLMPNHPVNFVMLQTMGIRWERPKTGSDPDKAMIYYLLSLAERRKLAATLPHYLVTCLNNVASQCIQHGQFDKALRRLVEALNLRRKLGWWDYNTGLTLWYLGEAYMMKRLHRDAISSMEQATEVFLRCTPNHFANVELRHTLAHAYLAIGKKAKAEEKLVEILEYEDIYHTHMDKGEGILLALEHIFLLKANTEKRIETYDRLIAEAERLCVLYKQPDYRKYLNLQRKLVFWRVFLGKLFSSLPGNDMNDNLHETCLWCKGLEFTFADWLL